MNKLKTSTKVLISIAAAAVVLATVLLLTMPEPWAQHFNSAEFFEKGPSSHFMAENGEEALHGIGRFNGEEALHGAGRFGRSREHRGGPIFPILLIGGITFFIIRKKKHGGRKNNSRNILDQQFAEGKIDENEYNRKKTVIEEGNK
jgi:hypothetical protein